MSNGIFFFSQHVGCLFICTYGLMLVLHKMIRVCHGYVAMFVCLFVSAGACNLTNYSMPNHGEW